ncbi:carboxypeptidase-like regulatory domain-containing protein [Aestuariivivens marinum]|uniref:carboxypeptidase-like regulatory domain-containing protein n=1 Tax=Aestuariivivens marinum TaxID=2913555 RepID=UPI001F5AEC1F|nr:carboxypeptidase-like regulatory domain-containing protein [Aestuariivivens marinum]
MQKIKLLILFIAFNGYTVNAQEIERTKVIGKLVVENNDVIGITIFNASSNKGTITDVNGEFTLAVALNDLVEVSALQYQNISFRVNENILASKFMKIFLIEEINKLDEVVIFSNNITGNLELDINNTKTFKLKLDVLYFAIKNKEKFEFETDQSSKVNNITLKNPDVRPMINGLNIINVVDQLLLPLFRAQVKDKKTVGVPEVPVQSIKYYFGSEFIIDNFNIPKHRVEQFIRFVEDHPDFDYNLLNYGKELEFLELLYKKSQEFLKM